MLMAKFRYFANPKTDSPCECTCRVIRDVGSMPKLGIRVGRFGWNLHKIASINGIHLVSNPGFPPTRHIFGCTILSNYLQKSE